MSLRRAGFAYNPTIPRCQELRRRARAWCEAREVEWWEAPAEDRDQVASLRDDSDVLVVLGGDGTFLRTARAVDDSGVPMLGVNLGRIGFLAKVEGSELEGALDQVAAGDFSLEERLRVSATLHRLDGGSETHPCLNEVAVARGAKVRMIQAEVDVSGSHLATYVADAVVIATPTGSTAYSFSAGGAILDPRLRNLIITPVAAYLQPLHSVVAGENHVVTVTLRDAVADAIVSMDGQMDLAMQVGERVEVRALEAPLRLIEPAGSTPFYELLRTKASLLPH